MSRCVICFTDIMPQVTWANFLTLPKEEKVCLSCLDKLEIIKKPGCLKCGRIDTDKVCFDCERWEKFSEFSGVLERNVAVFKYNDFAKELVVRWKYRGDFTLIEVFAETLQTKHQEQFHGMEADYVAIPLSKERLSERGFNQSKAIISLLGVQANDFFKRKGNEKQSKRGRAERIEAENPFILKRSVDRPVVLVDDIYTTGTTVRHLARLLREAGCPSVSSLTLFR
ncbi:ComF family protein [Halobacillus sp. Marseille-Q1614]|uniref:ComF family protein n=1 Tax=Halobacillus sp. Marseille-Q1614 TaxID=2709134 RepID=UPI00156E6B05|nr:ComF family protein [Halobacillus sp. Marseille-Q1614]